MRAENPAIMPPAPQVHPKDSPSLKLLMTEHSYSLRDLAGLHAFDVPFSRNRLFGLETVLINDPAGVRHMLTTNAANYVRPAMMPRIMQPVLGQGLLLSEGGEWRRQRRMLSPAFTPNNVNILLPHLIAAANDLVRQLGSQPHADLSDAFQSAALNAVLRALFSLPGELERSQVGHLVHQYINGPGRPQVFDGFAKSANSFPITLGPRRAFQKRWFAAVDAVVSERRRAPRDAGHRDLLDLLIAARDPESGHPLSAGEVRDQCATMIFAGYETTARLMFWATYLITLDQDEQTRLRAEVNAFPPENIATLDDLGHWPRLRRVLLEALRLYPPVPLLVREPLADDTILGETVRRGTQVYVSPWVLHRHRKYWPSPTAFMPDRFADQASPWTSGGAYLPFGAGPRICIGAIFALAEAQIMLASVLQRYSLKLHSSEPVLPVGRLTIQPSYAPLFAVERTSRN